MKYVYIYVNCIRTLRRRRRINERRHGNPPVHEYFACCDSRSEVWNKREIEYRTIVPRFARFCPPPSPPHCRYRAGKWILCPPRLEIVLDRHGVAPNTSPIIGIFKRIRYTWLTVGCEVFLETRRNVLIFLLKLTCLRDVCFQGGPSHVPSL